MSGRRRPPIGFARSSTEAAVASEPPAAPMQSVADDRVARLEQLLSSQPRAALGAAREALASGDDPSMLRIVGIALGELGRLPEARRALQRCVALADARQEAELSASARTSLARVLLDEGDHTSAVAMLEALASDSTGSPHVHCLVNLSLAYFRIGDAELARRTATSALQQAQLLDDTGAVVRCINNLGVFELESGDPRSARRSFIEAERLAIETAQSRALLWAKHNRGVAEMRAGNVPLGFRLVAETIETLRTMESSLLLARALIDHADALLSASLMREAAEAVTESVGLASGAGATFDMAEGWQRAADIAFVRGRFTTAHDAAATATALYSSLGRSERLGHLDLLRLTAGLLAGRPVDTGALDALDMRAVARTRSEIDARLRIAQALRGMGPVDAARRVVEPLTDLRRSRSPLERITGHEAAALHGLLTDDLHSATRDAGAGLRLVGRHAVSLRSTELRLGLARRVEELAAVQIEVGVRRRSPGAVLRAIEVRGNTGFAVGAGTGPAAPEGEALGELRTVIAQLRANDLDVARRRSLEERERRIERRVRTASRGVASGAHAVPTAVLGRSARELLARKDHLTVMFGDANGLCHRVTSWRGRTRLDAIDDAGRVSELLVHLRLATRRLVPDESGRWQHTFDDLTLQLGDALLEGVPVDRARSVTIVPSASLADVPWSGLPSMRCLPVSVAPSLQVAARPVGTAEPPGVVVAVAGPDLAHAADEAQMVARIHHGTAHFGAAATSELTRLAFGNAELVHVAAHGALREDNPSMSSVTLADGPLTVYDLENLPRLAPIVVLSSCSVARPDASASSTLSSFVAALLAKGTSTVIAATDRVSDVATAALMAELHGEIGAGASPTIALARARSRVTHATANLFTCWGSSALVAS